MLDINFIRKNPQKVKDGALAKGVNVEVDKILEIDKEKRELISLIENKRSLQKKETNIEEAQKLKQEIKDLERKLNEISDYFESLLLSIPNLPASDVKIGKDERENEVLKEEGTLPSFEFVPKSGDEIGEFLGIIDTKRAAKISGSRFGFIKGKAAILEFALINFVFDLLLNEGFIPVIPPVMLREEIMKGLGYLEMGKDEMYYIEKDKLFLAATAEHPLVAMHKDEIFNENELPLRYVGFSSAFRREAGSYGKDVKGIFRVHQFDKVEMVSFVKPEDGDKEHYYLLSLEEKIVQMLGLPYRVVKMCSGDLGFPVARKFDIEVYFPSQSRYRETHSCSTCTDFQARRLNIRFKEKNTGKNKPVHILNATGLAIGRTILAILENYQQKDGSVLIPKILQKYTGFEKLPQLINKKE